ncbi:MAG: SDR family oxidoreductase [Candidatus Omnitrophica bacterium]|nr:SDR family oxidoreductase [Candidatus Omnitrophota bacterium]
MQLEGKTALITGAAKRIGRQIALDLASAGMNIIVHYHRSQKEAHTLKEEIEACGVEAYLIRADLNVMPTSKVGRFVRELFKKIDASGYHADVLVNNASIYEPASLSETDDRAWDRVMTLNLKVPFFLAREASIRMLKRHRDKKKPAGKIINLTDWQAFRQQPRYLAYVISKAALISATEGLAKALAPAIQVNSIAPGPILPPPGKTAGQAQEAVRKTVLKRFGSPRDISNAVTFLIENDFITGATLPIEGGALISG